MAGYAALTSLVHAVKQVQEYGRNLIIFEEGQVQSLGQKVGFLQDFLEIYSNIDSKEAENLEIQIAYSAYAAEDIIESRVINRIHAGLRSAVLCDLDEVIEILDAIKKRVADATEENHGFEIQKPENSVPATSSRPAPIEKVTVVGLDGELLRVMDWLTGGNNARQTISIVGMGGIGKTTLTRSVFEKPLIVKHFDIHIWVTVSQKYTRHKILLEMASCLPGNYEISGYDEEELGELLHKSLSGRRYMVVMDDMWSIEAWDMVRFFLPDNSNRSRVVVTTRQEKMAASFGRFCVKMELFDKDKSWDLFCKRAFGQETCPLELENVGKEIAEKCKGLPLSIVVIAGLLANSYRTQEYWKSASEYINSSTLNSGDNEYCMKILSLSYNYLPVHLKPCYLYLGLFPEDHEIHVSQLVKLWAAEGFLKVNGSKSSEEVAEDYLLDLVSRNLVLAGRQRRNGSIKTCRVHDLLRDICVRIAPVGRFLCLFRISGDKIPQGISTERRIVVHSPQLQNLESGNHFKPLQLPKSASLCRSLMGDFNEGLGFPAPTFLRVYVTNTEMFSPTRVLKLVNLRYLSFKHHWLSGSISPHSFPPSNPGTPIPSTISLLWNVQTIILRGLMERFILPSEFWLMSQLRHVEFDEVCLPHHHGHGNLVLANLETLSSVVKFMCDEEMVKRIPNIKKLKITYYNVAMYYDEITDAHEAELINSLAGSCHSLKSLDSLEKLESLYVCFHGSPQENDSLNNIPFPHSLKKLTLLGTRLEWEDMTIIGSLPNLEVLALEIYSVSGPECNPAEGGFPRLKFLKIRNSELERFNADETHFPALETLVFENLEILDEIPLGVGYISTLKLIDLSLCSDSAVTSAKKIIEEQACNGDEEIQARVLFKNNDVLLDFMLEMEFESLASDNFQVSVLY